MEPCSNWSPPDPVGRRSTLHDFLGGNGGRGPQGELTFDRSGNLYGTTAGGGLDDSGTVFELASSGGIWLFSVLYSVPGGIQNSGPQGNLARDAAGNLYGATYDGGAYRYGNVFKLTPTNGGWTYTNRTISLAGLTGQIRLAELPWMRMGISTERLPSVACKEAIATR